MAMSHKKGKKVQCNVSCREKHSSFLFSDFLCVGGATKLKLNFAHAPPDSG